MASFTIRLEDLCIEMYLGLHDFERERMQRVFVSVDLDVDCEAAGGTPYFDYDPLADFIRAFAGTRIDTQEELIMRIHGYITGFAGVRRAKVCSRKPDVYPDCASIGVCYSG